MEITDKNNFKSIYVKEAQNITLNNDFDLVALKLSGRNITIGNKKIPTTIKYSYSYSSIEADKKITLTNCTLENYGNLPISLNSPQIEVKDIMLKDQNEIIINKNSYHPKFGERHVTITDKDIARTNLISTLKGYQLFLQQLIATHSQEYLSSEFKEEQKLIEEKEQALRKLQQELEMLKQELKINKAKKAPFITKTLAKKTIKYYNN